MRPSQFFTTILLLATSWGVLTGCTDGVSRCDAPIDAWIDDDGDGFGGEFEGEVCELTAGLADKPLDCDDADPATNPDGEELCDGLDNNCDGILDEGHPVRQWYADTDEDGFGNRFPSILACDPPDGQWSETADDCDDTDPGRNPGAVEVCGGVDEDCDGWEGDFDDSVDNATFATFYRDNDGDTFGDHDSTMRACLGRSGFSPNDLDCDDNNDRVAQFSHYADLDGDGYGDANDETLSCQAPAQTVRNPLDCDDGDPDINIDRSWYADTDADGFGDGVPVGYQCDAPTPQSVLNDDDCDDTRDDVYPSAPDTCLDGLDANCDNTDACRSCGEVLVADPTAPSGVYGLKPVGVMHPVWCDMDTDGGGWTLVASSRGVPLDDRKGGYHNELDTMAPGGSHTTIWDGLRTVLADDGDIRFACKVNGSDELVVDLSFYDIHWYMELTASASDSNVCFNESQGAGYDQPAPARRNNLTGDYLPVGDDWNATGYLEGEDNCSVSNDFTIDFDDRGIAGNPNDGTDWGEDGGNDKCGVSGVNGTWLILVR